MKARAGQVGATAGNLWNGSRAHMKASVTMLGHIWDKGRTHVGQGQDTFGTSREVGTMAGHVWCKGRKYGCI